jgi:hypothetical protein
MTASFRQCRGYRSATYDQAPHLVPDDAAHWYSHKTTCRTCYLTYAADWRAKRISSGGSTRPSRSAARQPVLDGVASLRDFARKAGYPTIVTAVAEHAIFLPPSTVAQAGHGALFRIVRDYVGRGTFGDLPDGRRVLLDDNTSPTLSFLWSAGLGKGPDIQFSHLWTASRDPDAYTALWNLCVTPAFLAKATDGSNHPDVLAALRYRAFDLYGRVPSGFPDPPKPDGYGHLRWAPFAPAVSDLERELRQRLAGSPKSRPTIASRELGWHFSDWVPDSTL